MEITIKKTETTTQKIDVELPYYSKNSAGTLFYKVFNNKDCLMVGLFSDWCTIGVATNDLAFDEQKVISDEKEFENVYENALNLLNELKNNK